MVADSSFFALTGAGADDRIGSGANARHAYIGLRASVAVVEGVCYLKSSAVNGNRRIYAVRDDGVDVISSRRNVRRVPIIGVVRVVFRKTGYYERSVGAGSVVVVVKRNLRVVVRVGIVPSYSEVANRRIVAAGRLDELERRRSVAHVVGARRHNLNVFKVGLVVVAVGLIRAAGQSVSGNYVHRRSSFAAEIRIGSGEYAVADRVDYRAAANQLNAVGAVLVVGARANHIVIRDAGILRDDEVPVGVY